MQLRLGNVLPNLYEPNLLELIDEIRNVLKIYMGESNLETAIEHLDKIIKEKFQQLESQPSIILGIFLNSRYVLFSIYALKNKVHIKSLEIFSAINDIYKPLITGLQQHYKTNMEDIVELLSHDFDSVQSLGFSSLDYVGIGIFLLDKHFNSLS